MRTTISGKFDRWNEKKKFIKGRETFFHEKDSVGTTTKSTKNGPESVHECHRPIRFVFYGGLGVEKWFRVRRKFQEKKSIDAVSHDEKLNERTGCERSQSTVALVLEILGRFSGTVIPPPTVCDENQ